MPTFVALLRAVNVSGQNKVPMAELRLSLETAGFGEVRTYVQSGNVVFDAEGDDPAGGDAARDDPTEHAAAIHGLIAREFGCDVRVLVLTADEMQRVAAEMPFVGAADFDDRWVHATFLERPVEEAAFGGLSLPAQVDEQAVLAAGDASLGAGDAAACAGGGAPAGRTIYLYLPHGYGRTRLNNAYFERALKTPATTRNWRTVLALLERSAQEGSALEKQPIEENEPPSGTQGGS